METKAQSALVGTETELLLKKAADGEANAYTKYMLYADTAAREGYEPLRLLFERLAGNEKEHAEQWLGYLDELGSTEENLENALAGERYESTTFYPEASRKAKDEGFDEIAAKLAMTGTVEENHAREYASRLEKLRNGKLYNGDADTEWVCLNCGYRTRGNKPPEHCPLCSYPMGFFERSAN